jgi:ATP synthase protein I
MNGPFDHGFDDTSDPDAAQEPAFKALTPEEVSALRAKNPPVSPWRILAAQAVFGVACALVTWGLTHRASAVWSALWGAAVVVVPGALLAWGIRRGTGNPASAAVSFMFWELVKIAVAASMLVGAAVWAHDLSWPAMLVTMVVSLKMGWLVLLLRRRPVVTTKTKRV